MAAAEPLQRFYLTPAARRGLNREDELPAPPASTSAAAAAAADDDDNSGGDDDSDDNGNGTTVQTKMSKSLGNVVAPGDLVARLRRLPANNHGVPVQWKSSGAGLRASTTAAFLRRACSCFGSSVRVTLPLLRTLLDGANLERYSIRPF